jgi:segregation and condensation protein B
MNRTPESHLESESSQDLSLDALTAAFAEAIGRSGGPSEGSPASGDASTAEAGAGSVVAPGPFDREAEANAPSDSTTDPPDDNDDGVSPISILEAMLFVGDRGGGSLAPERAAALMRGVASDEIPGLVDQLNARYRGRGCPYEVTHVGAGYRMTLRPEFYPVRDRFFGRVREARLSQAALDVLAIVAYQQPVTAEVVGTLRGTPSHPILTQLVRRRLLRIERSPDSGSGQPHTTVFYTTDRFLQLFGLKTLGDLPQSEEIDGH